MPHCCYCEAELDAAAGGFGGAPRPPDDGDVSLCMFCGSAMIFDSTADCGFRPPTNEETAEIETSPTFQFMKSAWADTVGKNRQ